MPERWNAAWARMAPNRWGCPLRAVLGGERGDAVSETIDNLSHESRLFEPPAELAANANVKAQFSAYDQNGDGFIERFYHYRIIQHIGGTG